MSVIRRLNDRGIYLVRPTILTVDKEQFTEDEYPSDDETDTGATKTFTCSKSGAHPPSTVAVGTCFVTCNGKTEITESVQIVLHPVFDVESDAVIHF